MELRKCQRSEWADSDGIIDGRGLSLEKIVEKQENSSSFGHRRVQEMSNGAMAMNARVMLRLTAPVLVTSLLLLMLTVGTAWYVHSWQKTVAREVRVNVLAMRAAEELEIVVREHRARLDRFLITNDRRHLRALPRLQKEVDHWLVEGERWAITENEKKLMARFKAGRERFLTELAQLSSEDSNPSSTRVRKLIDDVVIKEMLEPVHSYLDVNEEEVEQAIANHELFAERLVYALLLLGTLGSGAGLVAGFGIARGFSRSLIQLSVPIRAVAGQLDEVVGPVMIRGGDLPEMEGTLHLISARIGSVLERLRQSERETLRAEQLAALGQMAAGMAHELRNPLTSMKMLVQGAQMSDPWSSEGSGLNNRDLQVLESEISRLERLTQEFLDYARPPQPEKYPTDLVPLIEEIVSMEAARAEAGGVQIQFSHPQGVPQATVDRGQFRQVLLNLLLNAIDASSGKGVVEVALVETGDGLDLRVSDDGCGLPAHLGPQIFAPFTTTKETGLGLGLSVSRRIAEAHGGTLTAADRKGGGAVFTFHLPLNSRDDPRKTSNKT
jgi:two-component system, NtrC family, sensor histidine kinase HydH